MPTGRVTTPDGQSFEVPIPEGVSPETAARAIDDHFTKMGLIKPAAAAGPPDTAQNPAVAPEAGMAGRMWNAGQPQGRDTIQKIGDLAIPMALQVPPTMAGGALAQAARIPAAVGRVGATAGLSMGKQALEGKNPLSWETIIDSVVAAGTESAGAVAGAGLKKLGAAARGFEFATNAPGEALAAVRDRISHAKNLVLPALDPAKKVTWDQAIAALRKSTGDAYITLRSQLIDAMNQVERRLGTAPRGAKTSTTPGGKPLTQAQQSKVTGGQPLGESAGDIFARKTSEARFPASAFSEVAQAANAAARNPVARSAADVATQQEPVPGVPAGLFAIPAAAAIARRLPVVGPWMRAAEEMGNQ